MRLGTCVSQTSACSAGVPGGPKTGGMPLVPRLVPRRQRIVIFPLERSGVHSARGERREIDGERTDLVFTFRHLSELLVLLVNLHNRTSTSKHI